ncbi:MAG TPA: hypothetical protein DEA26_09075 [Oceanospirillales bacterium]|nr:hypothetical protein [Oceanospirillaceae bacterium]HBS42819.1 hypothetical protein [Oceanospirillales bacterium]|tara:strand:+ start:369 stop:629 length:261 start_codon:yes stop_codon:yes gene_type:complete
MKKVLIACFAMMMSFSGVAFAAHHEGMPDREAVKAAKAECRDTVAKGDREAMRACMEEKGFTPPEKHKRPCDDDEKPKAKSKNRDQ